MSSPINSAESVPSKKDSPVVSSDAKPKQSRIISAILSPAVRLWVRSQLEQVTELQLSIEASDRQVLLGAINQVSVSACNAIYRGIHLSQVHLVAREIRTNLRQVLQGSSFRLLAPFPVSGEVRLSEADLNASLKAPLLANAIAEFLLIFLRSADDNSEMADQLQLQSPQIRLSSGQATLSANLLSVNGNATPVAIRTGLRLENGNQLKLDRPQWLPHANARQGLALKDLDGYTFDLGSDVALNSLGLEAGGIVCSGQLSVTPEEN